jgi:rhodanese-related sulfurtransferase/rubrerythrin
MELQAKPGQVANIFQEQLRAYMARHHESEYLVVDVREPAEYANGHIPGARLMPLSDFDVRVAELAKLDTRNLVFYCRSGARSARVSEYASLTIGFPHVFNLIGGFTAWSGSHVIQMPRLKSFHVSSDARAIIYQALELEKGAERFYAELVDHFSNTEAAVLMAELAGAEVAHGRVLYDLLGSFGGKPPEDFDRLFASLPGEVIEDGRSLAEALHDAKQAGLPGALALLEMALEIELSAYDLYKNLSDDAPNESTRLVLTDLAQHEKRHADGLLRKIERFASTQQAVGS